MIKKYCDWCEEEMDKEQSEAYFFDDFIYNSKEHLCYKCVRKIKELRKDISSGGND